MWARRILPSIVSLQKLDLGYTLLADSALSKLTPLVNLQSLGLGSSQVEGPGFVGTRRIAQAA